MKVKTFKKLTAVVLAVMLVMSMCVTGISTSAATSTYVVAGTSNLCGSTWDSADETNLMSDEDGDGIYEIVYTDVAVYTGYQFKVVENGANWYGNTDGSNITFNITSVCDVTVTFDSSSKNITVTGDGVEFPNSLDIDAMYAVGNGEGAWLNDVLWDPANDANKMAEISTNVYEITYEDVPAATGYQVKFTANGSWTDNWGGSYTGSGVETDAWYNSDNITFDVTYDLADVTLKLDLSGFNYSTKSGAKFTVTITDATEVEPTEPTTEATEPVEFKEIYYTDTVDSGWTEVYVYYWSDDNKDMTAWPGTAMNPYNRTTYYTQIPADAQYVIFNNNNEGQTDELTIPTDGRNVYSALYQEWFYAGSTEPSHGSWDETEPTEPVAVDYVLFGYIDGADYGDGDDYATIGDYKFVDGTLTTTFNETSYVGVKTSDLSAWYMTDGWAGSVTEVTLYNTADLTTTADKLMVPGGVEITFTLVENGDGTLTLSYVAAEAPTTEPTTEATEPETEPETTEPVESKLIHYTDTVDSGWTEVYVYYWSDDNKDMTAWPGTAMNPYNRTTYYTQIPADAQYVIFNNNDGGQTDNLTIPTDGRNVYSALYQEWFYAGSTEPSHGSWDETIPVETEATEPVAVDYVLFGYIDGADYGDGDDYATIGDYKFVDGTLTTTFNETSYVGVKTSDLSAWYMTDGWAGSVTEVTLYNTADLTTTADKLMVPGGVEITFTLVENGDGTLTLSYVAEEAPTTEPTTEATEPTTEATEPQGVKIVGDDINLELTNTTGSIYKGSTELAAGTYSFKVEENGTALGFGSTFNNSIYNIQYKAEWQKSTTFNANGGKYSFTYNADTDKLTVICVEEYTMVITIGDLGLTLTQSALNPDLFTAVTTLEADSYEFKIKADNVEYGCGCTFNNSMYKIQYSADWQNSTTFNANGGRYRFIFDTSANQLSVLPL